MINGNNYEMLIDSGAEISAISEAYFEQIIKNDPKTPMIPLTGLCVHNAVGDKATKVTTQILVPIEIEKNTILIPFIVVKNLNEKGIIGNDFLEIHEAAIDLGKRNLTLNVNNIKNKIKLLDKIQEQPVHLRTVSTKVIMEPSVTNKQIGLPNKLQDKLDNLVNQFPEVFSEVPGKIKNYTCKIRLKDNRPINQRPYPIPITKKEAVKKEIQRMVDLDIIEVSRSPYSLPIIPVFKKKIEHTHNIFNKIPSSV